MLDKYGVQVEFEFDGTLIEDLCKKLESLTEEEKLETFEYYEEQLDILMKTLNKAYEGNQNDHARNIRKGIDDLITKADKTANLPEHKGEVGKRIEQYNTILEKDKLLVGNELYRFLEEDKQTKNDTQITEQSKESDVGLKHKSHDKIYSDYKTFDSILCQTLRLCGTLRILMGGHELRDIRDRTNTLRANVHKKMRLDEENIDELGKIVEKAYACNSKKFTDIKKSYDTFKKSILE